MTIEDVEKMYAMRCELSSVAMPFILDYMTYKGLDIRSVDYLDEMTDFDEDTITFEGDEYWRYGGHEHHHLEMPTRFVFDEKYRLKLKTEYEDGIKKAEEAKKAEEVKAKRAKAARERRQYEKLKKKFESDG